MAIIIGTVAGSTAAAGAASSKAAISTTTALSLASLAASAGGAILSATQSTNYGGLAESQEAMARYQQTVAERRAQQLDIQAGQERASSQREAAEERRQVRFAQSRAQALAGASGAGALDPSVLDVVGDLEGEAEYRALTRLYEGESRARGFDYGATLERSSGQAGLYEGYQQAYATRLAGHASKVKRLSTVLSSAGSLMGQGQTLLEKYG